MNFKFPPVNVSTRPVGQSFSSANKSALTNNTVGDSIHFSGKAKAVKADAVLEDTPENREAVTKAFNKVFPFDQYVAFLDAMAVEDGAPAGTITATYTKERIKNLKSELIDYFRDGEELPVQNIQELIKDLKSDQKRVFNWIRGVERDMGYPIP